MTTIFSAAGTGSRLWYASRTAAPGGNGTQQFPFQTFQAALNACAPGDGVVLLPGTYPENIVWPATDNIVVFSWGAIVTAAVGDTLSWIPVAPPFPVGAVFDVAIEAAVATVMPGITVKTPAAFTASGVTLTVNFDLVRA